MLLARRTGDVEVHEKLHAARCGVDVEPVHRVVVRPPALAVGPHQLDVGRPVNEERNVATAREVGWWRGGGTPARPGRPRPTEASEEARVVRYPVVRRPALPASCAREASVEGRGSQGARFDPPVDHSRPSHEKEQPMKASPSPLPSPSMPRLSGKRASSMSCSSGCGLTTNMYRLPGPCLRRRTRRSDEEGGGGAPTRHTHSA